MINLMDSILKKVKLDLKLTPYRVLASSPSSGFVEFVPDSSNLSKILDNHNKNIGYGCVCGLLFYLFLCWNYLSFSNYNLNWIHTHHHHHHISVTSFKRITSHLTCKKCWRPSWKAQVSTISLSPPWIVPIGPSACSLIFNWIYFISMAHLDMIVRACMHAWIDIISWLLCDHLHSGNWRPSLG